MLSDGCTPVRRHRHPADNKHYQLNAYQLPHYVPELSAKHQKICGVLLGALGHFLCSVPQPVEAVVDLFNQLSARQKLCLDIGGEVFLTKKAPHNSEKQLNGERVVSLAKCATNLGLCRNSVGHELITRSLIGVPQLSLDVLRKSDGHVYYATASLTEREAAEALHTEPLKVRKVFSSSSSEKVGWRATKLMNLPSARLLPSMNSRSETEVRTADRRQRNTEQQLKQRELQMMSFIWCHFMERKINGGVTLLMCVCACVCVSPSSHSCHRFRMETGSFNAPRVCPAHSVALTVETRLNKTTCRNRFKKTFLEEKDKLTSF